MLTVRKKRNLITLTKLAGFVMLGAIVFTPKDIDLSGVANFNPLVTQVQASE